MAHDWYPPMCCSGHDCHPIDCSLLIEKGKSIFYHGHEFFNNAIQPSQDTQCHVCITNEFSKEFSPVPHCVFIQQGS